MCNEPNKMVYIKEMLFPLIFLVILLKTPPVLNRIVQVLILFISQCSNTRQRRHHLIAIKICHKMSYSEIFITTAVSPSSVSMSGYYIFYFFSHCAQRPNFSDKLKEYFFSKHALHFQLLFIQNVYSL